jgi:Ca-activated chloride channel family protein
MRFASPLYFLILALTLPLVWWELKKSTGTIKYSDLSFFKKSGRRGQYLKFIPLTLNIAGLCLITLALARPQLGRVYEEVESSGVDIMLCLDISGTMQAEDFSPKNRLFVAKERAKEFIEKRPGDRIGLVIFASQAMTQCPLTLDHKILTDLIDRVNFGIVPDGTAIGMGLATALARLKDSKAREKMVVLLTDGLNNTGDIDPITAAKVGQAYKIKVYCIGVGSKGPVPIPVNNPFYGRQYIQAEVDLDMNKLNEISALTGGKAFLATDAEALKIIYDEINQMEPTTFKVLRHTVYSERAGVFLLPAALVLLFNALLALTILRRLP